MGNLAKAQDIQEGVAKVSVEPAVEQRVDGGRGHGDQQADSVHQVELLLPEHAEDGVVVGPVGGDVEDGEGQPGQGEGDGHGGQQDEVLAVTLHLPLAAPYLQE